VPAQHKPYSKYNSGIFAILETFGTLSPQAFMAGATKCYLDCYGKIKKYGIKTLIIKTEMRNYHTYTTIVN